MKALLAFGLTDTGITLGALTVDSLRDVATNTDHSVDWMVGATLENAGMGVYYLNCPAATAEATVSVHVTADATKWADGVFETPNALATVDTVVDAIQVDVAAVHVRAQTIIDNIAALGIGVGSGASHDTITVVDGVGDPVADCEVWVTSDLDGTAIVAGPLVTDDDGTCEFLLDAGVQYYAWRRKSGMNFTNPVAFVSQSD